jgi:hypothetical protein
MLLRVFLLCIAVANGQRTEVPWGGGGCRTDMDCSLGGVCYIPNPKRPIGPVGRCKCDPWFTGLTCSLLNLQRPKSDQQGLCHKGFDSYFSWGGRAIPEVKDGTPTKWHLYASFMCEHNTLQKWTTVSSSAHFVSEEGPVGPFEFSPEQCTGDVCSPSIIPWSHNTVAMQNTNAKPSEAWQIWHIGDGIVNASKFSPCFNKSEVGGAYTTTTGATTNNLRSSGDPGAEVFISSAASPSGPWTRTNQNAPLKIKFDPSGAWPQSATK